MGGVAIRIDAGQALIESAVRRGVREQGGPAADDLRAQGAGCGREGRGGSGAAVHGLGSFRFRVPLTHLKVLGG